MKKLLSEFFILMTVVACANTPYVHKDKNNGLGYWSEKVSEGIFKVYISFSSSTSKGRINDYLWIQGYEQCAKDEYFYYYLGDSHKVEGFKNETLMSYVYCYKDTNRYGLGIGFAEGSLTIEDIEPRKSRFPLEKGDLLLSLNGKKISKIDEMHTSLHLTKNKPVVVEYLRDNKKGKATIQPIQITYLRSQSSVLYWMKRSDVSQEQVQFLK